MHQGLLGLVLRVLLAVISYPPLLFPSPIPQLMDDARITSLAGTNSLFFSDLELNDKLGVLAVYLYLECLTFIAYLPSTKLYSAFTFSNSLFSSIARPDAGAPVSGLSAAAAAGTKDLFRRARRTSWNWQSGRRRSLGQKERARR